MSFTTDAARWRALTIRDASANGQFVYAVKSTNIYCRPICPARLARRANVGFYRTSAEAEKAGFRACKRCKPDAERIEDPQALAVTKVCNLIEEALKGEDPKSFRLQDLAKSVGLTPRYFHKIFKDKTGVTPKEYAKNKMQERRAAIAVSNSTQDQIAFESLSLDGFDFSDLVDFDLDPGPPVYANLSKDISDPTRPVVFGQEIDVNIVPTSWIGAYNLNMNGTGIQDNIKLLHPSGEPLGIGTTGAHYRDPVMGTAGHTLNSLDPTFTFDENLFLTNLPDVTADITTLPVSFTEL